VIPDSVLAGGYPHQKDELRRRLLASSAHSTRHFALWWAPGVGKTFAYIRFAMAHAARGDRRPHLITCPSNLTAQVAAECARFWPGCRVVRLRTGADRLPAAFDVVVVGYELLITARALAGALMAIDWCAMVFDESHYLRTLDAARTILCLGPHGQPCLAHKAAHRVFATGTPLVNHALDLYPTVRRLEVHGLAVRKADGTLRGINPAEYADAHVRYETKQVGGGRTIRVPVGSKGMDRLNTALRPYATSLSLAEVAANLPPLTVAEFLIDGEDVLEPLLAAGDIPETVVDQMLALLGEAAADGNERKQAAAWGILSDWMGPLSTYRRAMGLLKAPEVANLIRDRLAGGEDRCVVFFHHRAVGEMLATRLTAADIANALLYGGVAPPARERALSDFRTGRVQVLLAQFDSGGIGLNLQMARYSVFAELPWTATALTQALHRTHRIGQSQPTLAHVVTVPGSLDAAVAGVIMRKANEMTELTGQEVATW
jgi:hypothetical protein